jgi:hypothetical protein
MDSKIAQSASEKLDKAFQGHIVEMSQEEAIVVGAFVETAMSVEDALESSAHLRAIAQRREFVEQVEAIHNLEGMSAADAPRWFHELTEDYIQGNISAEAATQQALIRIRAGDI